MSNKKPLQARAPRTIRARDAGLRALVCVALGCGAGIEGSRSQEPPRRFELTLQAGYRVGGTFEDDVNVDASYELAESNSQRVTLNIAARADAQWEVLWGRQQTTLQTAEAFSGQALLDLDVDYIHFGGTYLFDGTDARPFIVLTAGLTRFEPSRSELDAENHLSMSIGGGVALWRDRRIGMRLEGRVFTSFVDSSGGLFCGSGPNGGVCAISAEGDAVVQLEAGVGIVYRF